MTANPTQSGAATEAAEGQESYAISPEQQALLDAEKADAQAKAAADGVLGNILGSDEPLIQTGPDYKAEAAQMKDQLIRTMAEMENVRKRTEREVQDTRKYAVTGFARDMVTVVENLQLALQNIPEEARKQDEKLETLAQGVEMTYNELLRVFGNHGIVRIDPVGEKFNHNHHQAVTQIEDPKAEPGTVVQVLQSGYIIHDRLLRPAMVVVAKGGSSADAVDTKA